MQTMYHECGYPFLMESVLQGSLFLAEFYDPNIKNHAKKVSHCPCCQKALGKKPLRSVHALVEQII